MRFLIAFALVTAVSGTLAITHAQAADTFSCELNNYYPTHETQNNLDPALTVKVKMSESRKGIEGTVEVIGHNPAIGFSMPVKKEVKAYVPKENMFLDNSLRSGGIQAIDVKTVESFTFGDAGNMGASAWAFTMKDKDGNVLDTFFHLWGARGMGSCKMQKALATDLD